MAVLSGAFAEDRIVLDELERRMTLVYSASTMADLDALIADMPASYPTADGAMMLAPNAARGALTAATITAVFSSQERTGNFVVPQHLRVRAVVGSAELDLTQATFSPGLTVIECSAYIGSVEITLPANVAVENAGSAFIGSFELQASDSPMPATTTAQVTVRITGRAVIGSVEARVTRFRSIEGGDDPKPQLPFI
ncbi:MAG: LiaF domain-containing protein [Gemmatimonadaceae bacterium]